MINDIIKYVLNFTLVVLIQVLIINNIPIAWYINPLFYIVFIITLPINIPGWLLLFSGFFLGLVIDLSANTPGMNMSATLIVSFMRPYLLNAMVPRDNYQPSTQPVPSIFGLPWFINYAAIMVFVHHFFLFFIESFSIQQFFPTLLKIIVSTLFSLVLILVVQMFKLSQSKVR
jgi:rod shape-determining protein MreD